MRILLFSKYRAKVPQNLEFSDLRKINKLDEVCVIFYPPAYAKIIFAQQNFHLRIKCCPKYLIKTF